VDLRPANGGPAFHATIVQAFGGSNPSKKYRWLDDGDVVRMLFKPDSHR
jgi:hypothetical protein